MLSIVGRKAGAAATAATTAAPAAAATTPAAAVVMVTVVMVARVADGLSDEQAAEKAGTGTTGDRAARVSSILPIGRRIVHLVAHAVRHGSCDGLGVVCRLLH